MALYTGYLYSTQPVRHHFLRSRVVVGGIDVQWQADLADVSWLASKNHGIKYLLTCIDIFSKYAWVEPLTSPQTHLQVISETLGATDRSRQRICQLYISTVFKGRRHTLLYHLRYNQTLKPRCGNILPNTVPTSLWISCQIWSGLTIILIIEV